MMRETQFHGRTF